MIFIQFHVAWGWILSPASHVLEYCIAIPLLPGTKHWGTAGCSLSQLYRGSMWMQEHDPAVPHAKFLFLNRTFFSIILFTF